MTSANKLTANVSAKAVESTKLIDAQAANWVVMDIAKSVVDTANVVSIETDAVLDTSETSVKDTINAST